MIDIDAANQHAEAEFHEYTRLLRIANQAPTLENACAAARQWGRFLSAYNDLPDVQPPRLVTLQ